MILVESYMVMKIEIPEGDSLNYRNIAEANWVLPTIRLLAIDMQKNPYATLGDWFRGLADSSVHELQELAETCYQDPDSETMEQMMLLTMMLASAEGTCDIGDMEKNRTQLGMMMSLITIVGLERKGLVRVFYENLTLGTDMSDAVIVEKL
jgi:hypothetical protein